MINTKRLDSKTAYKLLTEEIIIEEKDLKEDKNRWILHCLYSGMAAGRIAEKLGLDSDYAKSLGYIHDIGRRISHPKHPIEGYYYLKDKGYEKEARICLTHSFIDNDISLAAGPFPSEKAYNIINGHLNEEACSKYDNIIQLCDLFCLETGFTTIEKRILDISLRKGVYPCSKRHFKKTLELKEKIEKELGCNLYDLFPEISKKDLKDSEKHLEELEQLFLDTNFTPLNIAIASKESFDTPGNYYFDKMLRDGNQLYFLEELDKKDIVSYCLENHIDILYNSTEAKWGELTEAGIPCFLLKSKNSENKNIPTVMSWEQVYNQVKSVASSGEGQKTTEKGYSSKELVKK